MCKEGWALTPPALVEGKPLAAAVVLRMQTFHLLFYLINARDRLSFWELPSTLPILTHYINAESNCPQK